MAVNFQRRNIGVLADTPTFEDVGRSAYVDYGVAPQDVPAVMREAVAEADAAPVDAAPVAPPTGAQTPEAMAQYEAAQRAFLERAAIDAERKAKAAGNPLNVIGGVLGTPIKLLGNILGGQNDLTSAFTPNQNAQGPLAQAKANIAAQQLALAQKMDGYQSSLTTAMTNALTDRGKLVDETHERLSILALNVENDPNPQMAFERGKNRLMANPLYAPVMQELGYDEQPWYKGLAAELAQGKDVQGRIDTRNKITTTTLPYQSTAIQTDQYGKIVNVVQQDGSTSAPVVSPNPTPEAKLPPIPAGFQLEGGPTQPASGTFRTEQ